MNPEELTHQELPSSRAFVVQFHPAKENGSTSFDGRIEHLTSGRTDFFSSQEELCHMLDKLLKDN